MKRKTRLILSLVFLAGAVGAGHYFLLSKQYKTENPPADKLFGWKFPEIKFISTDIDTLTLDSAPALFDVSISPGLKLAYSTIRDPGGIPRGLPVRLKVPVIGVDSAIEDALITTDGRMDVPAGTLNVAWFALGPHPGEVGSAVIGGHFGISSGVKFVFYDLDKLVVGDKIYIENDKGETLAFQVRRIQLFERTADATDVFTSDDGLAHLNLITCEGIWNKSNGLYPLRRVVFTDAIPAEVLAPSIIAPVGVPAAPVVLNFSKTLRIGSRGADVTALQIALQQKGFFGVGPGVADGFFGAMTHTAVAKFQASAGLQADGVFGPLTRAKFSSEFTIVDAQSPIASFKPILPSTAITISESPTSSQTFLMSFKSLFATPLDGLITFILFISIIFVLIKIAK